MDVHPLTPTLSPVRQRWFVAGLLLFFVAVSVQYSFKVLDGDRENRSAYLRWREQILEFQDGVKCGPPRHGPGEGALLEAYRSVGMQVELRSD